MADRSNNNVFSGQPSHGFKESVCIDVDKIMDSCRDKDCLEDLKVFLTDFSQEVVDHATNIRCKDAEVIWTHVSVEPIPFNRGFFQIDIRYFFKCTFEACVCMGKTQEIEGIAVFDKRVILFGSEGNVNIFKSDPKSNSFCFTPDFCEDRKNSNLPIAVVEVVDPICLGVKIIEKGCGGYCCCSCESIPENICNSLRGPISDSHGNRDLVVTLGLFSIIRLQRLTQIVVPCADFCIPDKDCTPCGEEDPCKLFKKMKFPINEFFPPSLNRLDFNDEIIERGENRSENRGENRGYNKK